MRRTDIDGEGNSDANQGKSLSGSGRRLDTVIPFPSRDHPRVPAASNPSSADELDAFVCVGEAVAAVVLRLRGGFPKIKALVPAREEEEDRDQL